MLRGLLAAAALVLLGLGIVPLAAGHFHLGVLVPVGLGLVGGYLAWRWAAVQAWCAVAPWRRWLWRAAWLGLLLASRVGLSARLVPCQHVTAFGTARRHEYCFLFYFIYFFVLHIDCH